MQKRLYIYNFERNVQNFGGTSLAFVSANSLVKFCLIQVFAAILISIDKITHTLSYTSFYKKCHCSNPKIKLNIFKNGYTAIDKKTRFIIVVFVIISSSSVHLCLLSLFTVNRFCLRLSEWTSLSLRSIVMFPLLTNISIIYWRPTYNMFIMFAYACILFPF